MFTVRGRVGQRHNTALCEKQSVRPQTVATTEQSSRGTKQTGNLTKTHLGIVELRFYPTGRRTGIAPLWNPWEVFFFLVTLLTSFVCTRGIRFAYVVLAAGVRMLTPSVLETMESTRGSWRLTRCEVPHLVASGRAHHAVGRRSSSVSQPPAAAQHRPSLSREGNGTSMCFNDF